MRHRASLLLLLPVLAGAAWLGLPDHSFVEAIRPGLEAADEDGDGGLSSTELARSSPVLTSFHKIDQDQDGSLDEPELLHHLLAENPSNFDGEHHQLTPSPHDHFRYSPKPRPVRVLLYLYEFMLAEVLSVDKRIPLPSDEQIEAAAYSGSLDSEEALLVSANMVAAYKECGLAVPPFLDQIEPVLAEPGLRESKQRVPPHDRQDRGKRPGRREHRDRPPDVRGGLGGPPPGQGAPREGPPPGSGG